MSSFVALLRAVNLGGSTQVAMSEVRAMFEDLGFGGVRSLQQSGNLVFEAQGASPKDLEERIRSAAERTLHRRLEVLVRTAAEWRSVVENNPFREFAEADPSHLIVTFLASRPTPAAWKKLEIASRRGAERFVDGGRHAYFTYPDGVGRSKLTAGVIEEALGVRGTSRNWNTVLKLDAMVSGGDPRPTRTRA